MALIVEDGTIVSGANSFASIAGADAYFIDLCFTAWAEASESAKERALILGSRYVGSQQIFPYDGSKVEATQDMAWPRSGASYYPSGPDIGSAVIPPEIIQASIVAAGLALNDLLPTQSAFASPSYQQVKRERVEGAVTVDYFHSSEGADDFQSPLGAGALARLGNPDVVGLVAALLDPDIIAQSPELVTRAKASRRGVYYRPSGDSVPAFGRGMFDRTAVAEDETLATREPGS